MALESLKQSRFINRRVFYVLSFLIVLVLLSLFYAQYVLITALFLITVFVSWLVKVLEIKWMGIETATFATVIIGATTNVVTGALTGLVLILGQMAARQQFGTYILWVIPSYVMPEH